MNRRFRSLLRRGGLVLCAWLALARSVAASDIQTYVEAMQPGWNLGNSLDATSSETAWGNPPVTRELIQQIAAQGFNSIRIPVTWNTGNRLGPAPNYTITPAFMDRVQQVVDWSLDAGLHVMLNLHHDSDWTREMPTQRDAVLARYTALWMQIATRFRDHPRELMLESINEPDFRGVNDATKNALLHELNTVFVKIVRGTGGGNTTRPLVLPTVVTNSSQHFLDALKATMAELNDQNLIATIHYYGFWPFSVNVAGRTRFDAESIDSIVTSIDAVYETFVSRGIPVVIGEYGLLGYGINTGAIERGEMLKYFEYFTQYAQSKRITHQLWDNGELFNRATMQWRDSDPFKIIMHSLGGRTSTAETDLIFLRRGAPVQDVVINLHLNGNSFVSLQRDGVPLIPGVDYTINGSALTVKAATLAPYASGTLGEKAVLKANFSAGPGWGLRVRHHALAELSSATGTKMGGLVIPATFNGDLVATMEARYVSGGNAGPHNWTPFKEFYYTFRPDYAGNAITITKEFFADTTNNPIDLTFHFWSGRRVSYRLNLSAAGAVQGEGVAPVLPEYVWAAFTAGESGSWIPPEAVAAVGGTFSATGLPAWASLDAATGQISGTPNTSSGQIIPVTLTVSRPSQPSRSFRLNLVVASPGSDLAPVNLSSRGRVDLGERILIPGFVVGGSTPRTFLIRAVGPTLDRPPYNVSGALGDSTLRVYNHAGAQLLANDNWGAGADRDTLQAAFSKAGAFALDADSKDAALLVTLEPGAYSAHAAGAGDTTGVALVELYDLTGATPGSALVNISARAFVGSGDDVLISGIVLRGGGTRRLLVRAVGPALAEFGVQGILVDPQITLFKDGQPLAANDDWAVGADVAELQSVFARAGAFSLPPGSKDAVLPATLPEGAYSMVVRGQGNTTGVALVEVYVVP
jgi:endoglucanase